MRAEKSGPFATRFSTGSDRNPVDAPAWQDDPRERVRRLPAFMALEMCGAITRQHRENGDMFAMRYRMAVEHAPAVVGSYGSRGGHDVDEERQDAARRWVRRALRRAGPVAGLLDTLGRDQRPLLTETDIAALRAGLDAIRMA